MRGPYFSKPSSFSVLPTSLSSQICIYLSVFLAFCLRMGICTNAIFFFFLAPPYHIFLVLVVRNGHKHQDQIVHNVFASCYSERIKSRANKTVERYLFLINMSKFMFVWRLISYWIQFVFHTVLSHNLSCHSGRQLSSFIHLVVPVVRCISVVPLLTNVYKADAQRIPTDFLLLFLRLPAYNICNILYNERSID
jgi:hypothetical protein